MIPRSIGLASLLNNRTVAQTHLTPSTVESFPFPLFGAKRKLRGKLFVDFDAPSRLFLNPCIAVLQHGAPLKDLLGLLTEARPLLNAEVIADQIKCNVCRMTNRRYVPGSMPCGPDAKRLSKHRNLSGRAEPACLRNMHANVVNQAL